MSDQAEQQQPSLAEVAKEAYGDNYHSEEAQPEREPVEPAMTVDDAYDWLQEQKDSIEPEAPKLQQRQEIEPEQLADDDSRDDGGRWSDDDVQTYAQLQQALAQFQHDLGLFNQAKAQGIDKLAAGDKDKAKALRLQMAEAERELQERYAVLTNSAQALQGKASQKQAKEAEKRLKAEQAKLAREFPDLDKDAVRGYLRRYSFSDNEISQVADHRLVAIVEKARRYDEMTSGQKRVPKLKPGAKRHQPVMTRQERAEQEARQRLKKTGRIDDALNYLTLRRRSA